MITAYLPLSLVADEPHSLQAIPAERLFADEGDCLHASYTTWPEARGAIAAQWLGGSKGQRLTVVLTDARTRACQRVTFSGRHDQSAAMLAALGIGLQTGETDAADPEMDPDPADGR